MKYSKIPPFVWYTALNDHRKEAIVDADVRQMTWTELAAVCTNLEKACTKQLRGEEAATFAKLASFYEERRAATGDAALQQLLALIDADLTGAYRAANEVAAADEDRGSKRALLWGEKATKLLKSLLARYEKQGAKLTENTGVFVCEICGFVYVGDAAPEVCPICKVPSFKIHPVRKEAI